METSIDPDPFSFSPLMLIINDPSYFVMSVSVMAVLLLLSALISGSEVAFFSLNGTQLAEFAKSENRGEQRIYKLLQNPRKLLASILIFNNLVNVGFVTLATFLIWDLAMTKDPANVYNISAPFIITFLIVFFGEVIPKIYANQKGIVFAKSMALPFMVANKIFSPLIWCLLSTSNLIESRIQKKGYQVSVQDLNEAIEIATLGNKETSEEEKGILKGIINFSTISVTQVMMARIDIMALENTIDFHQLMDKINKSGFSRIPVYEETIDNIRGILYVKDLLPYIDQDENFKWQNLLRDAYFVPESKKIDDLLKNFQEKRVHMAIVIDEYGGTSGLITLEDVIEQIVGEINDEFDDDEIEYKKISDKIYVFEGKTQLHDVIKVLNLRSDEFDAAKGESESIGGMLLELKSSMPHVGDTITFGRFDFVIESVNAKRIKRVRIEMDNKKELDFED